MRKLRRKRNPSMELRCFRCGDLEDREATESEVHAMYVCNEHRDPNLAHKQAHALDDLGNYAFEVMQKATEAVVSKPVRAVRRRF